MLLPLLLLAGSFSFDGGPPLDFMRALSTLTNGIEIMAFDPSQSLGKIQITFTEGEDLAAKVAEAAHLRSAGYGDFTFWQSSYPAWMIAPNTSFSSERPSSTARAEISNGRISCGTGRPALVFGGTFESPDLSKPLRVQWIYQMEPVYVRARNAREPIFLRSLAAALGADFTESPKEYRFDFSPREFRKRAIETYERFRKLDQRPITAEQAAFAKAALAAATDKELSTAYETPESQVQIPMPATGLLHKLAYQRFLREKRDLLPTDGSGAANQANFEWMEKNVDFARSGYVILSAAHLPVAALPCKGSKNRWFHF